MRRLARFHYLKHNQKTAFPRHWVAFDVETTPSPYGEDAEIHRIRVGVARYFRVDGYTSVDTYDEIVFTDAHQLWRFILDHTKPKTKTHIIAHNVSFDIRASGLLKLLMDLDYDLIYPIDQNGLFIWSINLGDRRVVFLDSFNYLRLPLSAIGDALGVPKMRIPEYSDSDDAWVEYCRNDVYILQHFVHYLHRFLVTEDRGNFGYSAASLAFNTYRHRYMDHRILCHCHPKALNLERQGYYGGRTEAFYIGEITGGRFTLLDVNSLYPSVMRRNLYPTRIKFYADKRCMDKVKRIMEHMGIIADVILNTDEPAFPYKYRNKLVFPVGRFRTVLPHPEFMYAWEHGYVEDVKAFAAYELADIFTSYVDDIYAIREEYKRSGDKAMSMFCKLLLNSLYGRFAMLYRARDERPNETGPRVGSEWEINVETCRRYKVVYFGDKLYRFYEDGFADDTVPSIACFVTSYARMKLWEYINLAGRDHVYYCDTDSLLVDDEGLSRLQDVIDPYSLGALKVEYDCDRIRIYGCKDYIFGDVVKRKGVRKDAIIVDENTVIQDQFSSFKDGINRGIVDGVIIRKVKKTRRSTYEKGIVTEAGRVLPLHLDL